MRTREGLPPGSPCYFRCNSHFLLVGYADLGDPAAPSIDAGDVSTVRH